MMSIAEDMECGFQCSWCGVCFNGEHGYPVVCEDCACGCSETDLKELGLQRATLEELCAGTDNMEGVT